MVKHISVKETLLKLDLERKGQGYSKQQNTKQGNKNIPPLNKQTKALLCNCSVTDKSNRLRMTDFGEQKKVNKGQLRIIKLVVTTNGRFLKSMTKLNF